MQDALAVDKTELAVRCVHEKRASLNRSLRLWVDPTSADTNEKMHLHNGMLVRSRVYQWSVFDTVDWCNVMQEPSASSLELAIWCFELLIGTLPSSGLIGPFPWWSSCPNRSNTLAKIPRSSLKSNTRFHVLSNWTMFTRQRVSAMYLF